MSTKNVILFIILIALASCSAEQKREILKLNNCEVKTFNETAVLTPSHKGKHPIPEVLVYAKVNDRDCLGNKGEENLIRQYKTYVSALTLGDIEACKKYTFKDAVEYHKKMYPNLSEQDIWKQYFSDSVMGNVDKLTDFAAENGWDIVPCVPVFFDKVSCQNEIFITFGTTIYIDAHKFSLAYTKLEKCIAHSNNRGKNWEFITLNSDSRGILSLSCSDDVINILTKSSNVSLE